MANIALDVLCISVFFDLLPSWKMNLWQVDSRLLYFEEKSKMMALGT